MSTTPRTIEDRIRRLEIQNRLLLALLLMLVASLLVAATGKEAVPDVVRARADSNSMVTMTRACRRVALAGMVGGVRYRPPAVGQSPVADEP